LLTELSLLDNKISNSMTGIIFPLELRHPSLSIQILLC
jgi:hypothetical protein